MEIKLCGNGFVINSSDFSLFENPKKDLFEFSEEWEDSITQFFNNSVFSFDYTFFHNDIQISKTVVFHTLKRKMYIIDTMLLSSFIDKYFSNSIHIKRQPHFFSFLIPYPSIFYSPARKIIFEQDKYNVSLGKFYNQTYRSVENYTPRLSQFENSDFRNNECDPIFQKEFTSVFKLIEDYKIYLKLMLDIGPEKINVNKLITPYFLLQKNEILEIIKIEKSIYDDMYEAMDSADDESRNQEYEKWWNSTLDQLNNEAFENNPDNYWNID